VDDIENTKKRQWLIPYYILLLFAAIIGFVQLDKIKKIICTVKTPLSLLAITIAIAGIWHIIDAHFTQVKFRRQIYKLENRNFPFTYSLHRSKKKSLRVRYYLISFTFFLGAIILAGLFCALTALDILLDYRYYSIGICLIYGLCAFIYKYMKLKEEWPMPP
jgi:hypothetical protein